MGTAFEIRHLYDRLEANERQTKSVDARLKDASGRERRILLNESVKLAVEHDRIAGQLDALMA